LASFSYDEPEKPQDALIQTDGGEVLELTEYPLCVKMVLFFVDKRLFYVYMDKGKSPEGRYFPYVIVTHWIHKGCSSIGETNLHERI
jgi:hypothetical protein